MNQFSLNLQPSDTLWYTPTTTMEIHHQQQQQKPYPFFQYSDNDSDNNNNPHEQAPHIEKEHMFEKPLTPSDVGKLNRLVIPKQHAEKYLPLAAATTTTNNDGVAGGGGLLLGFEDESGKCWRFRYSYWNSSQSYVLTKGWSRYVKEKKLDAGDVVLFDRHRFEPDRFFIGWRRRGSNPPVHLSTSWTARSNSSYNFNINNHHLNHAAYLNNNHHNNHQISVFPNLPPDSPHQGTVQVRQKAKKSGGGNSKRVRLFGVNLECHLEDEEEEDIIIEDEPQTSDGSSLSSQGQVHGYGPGLTMGPTSYNHYEYVGYSPNHHNHNHNHNMDMNFPHDVNQQMRLG